MSSHENFLDNLRKKSETSKNIIAAVFAIIPAVLVGYAQFYMNDKAESEQMALKLNPQTQKEEVSNVSALASIGKIFQEGKDSLMENVSDFQKLDKAFLEETKKDNSASNTVNVVDSSNVENDIKINTTDN